MGTPDSKYHYYFYSSQDVPHLSDLRAKYGDQLRCAGVASTIGELYPDTVEQMPLEQFFTNNGISEYRYNLEKMEGMGWIEFSGDGWRVWIKTYEERIDFDDYKEITTIKRSYSVVIFNEEIYHDNDVMRYEFWEEYRDDDDYWNEHYPNRFVQIQ